MYYILYPIFYLLSLLPWRVMYFLSDVFAGIDDDINDQVEFGKYKKLGDTSSLREAF